MIINTAGEYTLQYTATDACGNSTTVERELVVEAPPYYGAVWVGSELSSGSSPQWTRTGLSADFSDPQPAVNNGTGSSPFDNIMPWSGMQIVEDAEAGTLVSIPKFYYKWIRDELEPFSMELQISMNQLDGFFVSPAHADRGDGVGERDVVYVGRYPCAGNDAKSAPQISPKDWLSTSGFRTTIHNLGQDVWQWDYAMFWTIAMLYLVEFANWNSQNMIGSGGLHVVAGGNTDAMQYHTGTDVSSRSLEGVVQYRNIEGLWSNVFTFVDGLYTDSNYVYAIKNPSLFSDTTNGTMIGSIQGVGGNPCKFSYPPNGFEYALYPILYIPNSSTNYDTDVCDYWKVASNSTFAFKPESSNSGGMFHINNYAPGTSGVGKGSRLMKLPSA